jgi:hypothetical protein
MDIEPTVRLIGFDVSSEFITQPETKTTNTKRLITPKTILFTINNSPYS